MILNCHTWTIVTAGRWRHMYINGHR